MAYSKNHRFSTSSRVILKHLMAGVAVVALLGFYRPALLHAASKITPIQVAADEPPPPPPPDSGDVPSDEPPPPPPDEGDPDVAPDTDTTEEIQPLEPGEAVVTRFSHTTEQENNSGKSETVIDLSGTSASIIDIRRPGEPPSGQHWIDEPQRMPVTAGEVGQVFGVTLSDDETPDIFLSATAAFGLHRVDVGSGQSDWMPGMWGPDAGPGTLYRLSVDNGFTAEKFADVRLEGRPNSGASLGNIAYDRAHKQIFVSDLETGMIHRIDAESGEDLGHFDHGAFGRTSFVDAWTGQDQSLDPVEFDSSSSAKVDSCPGDFSKTPNCWNVADFRRRIWGLGVRQDREGGTRLYYSVWGSDALGNAEWSKAGDDRRNSVWSVGISDNGNFNTKSVRREFFLPAFWPSTPDMGDKAGNSNPGSDITFPECGPPNVMIVSERGGMRNLGLTKAEPFARPHESRVLRYEMGSDGIWRPKGRYDVGFYDRTKDGPPPVFANASGGAAFDYGFDDGGSIDTSMADKSLWMTGDSLCSPDGACTSLDSGEHEDTSEVHGLQGSPANGIAAVEASTASGTQPASSNADFGVLDQSYMIDTDINVDDNGEPDKAGLSRNDATKIGDVAVYQVCEGAPPLPVLEPPDESGPPDDPPDYPVHTLAMSHEKWASTGHNVRRSWHERNASWHSVERSWHWRNRSWHSRSQTWHWRGGSWHTKAQSWHWKNRSWHDRVRSWHWKEGSWHTKKETWHWKSRSFHSKLYSWHWKIKSWHFKARSYHNKLRSWGNDHQRNKSWHHKGQTWGGQHVLGRSWHVKGQTWGGQHFRLRSYHKKNASWDGNHIKGKSFHRKGATWGDDGRHFKGKSFHVKGQTYGGETNPKHFRGKSFHVKGKTFGGGEPGDGNPRHVKGKSFHVKGQTFGGGDTGDGGKKHFKGKSFHVKGKTFGGGEPGDGNQGHKRKKSLQEQGGGDTGDGGKKHFKGKSFHVKGQSFGGGGSGGDTGKPEHKRKKSLQEQGGGGSGGDTGKPEHKRKKSLQDQGGGGSGGDTGKPQHKRKKSLQDQGGGSSGGDTGKPEHNRKKSLQDQGGSTGNTGNSDSGDSGQKVHKKKKSLQEQSAPPN